MNKKHSFDFLISHSIPINYLIPNIPYIYLKHAPRIYTKYLETFLLMTSSLCFFCQDILHSLETLFSLKCILPIEIFSTIFNNVIYVFHLLREHISQLKLYTTHINFYIMVHIPIFKRYL